MPVTRYLLILLFTLASPAGRAEVTSPEEVAREARAKVPHVSVQRLADSLKSQQDILLLDIRTEAEYQAGHIRGATWLPRGKLEFDIQKLTTDPEARIVLYCRTGGRSALGVASLNGLGYKNVVDLDGGFKAWVGGGNTFYNRHGELRAEAYGKTE